MEHDTQEGPGGNATVREEGPGTDDIDTEEEPVEIPLTQDQRVNNHTRYYKSDISSTLDPYIGAKGFTGI